MTSNTLSKELELRHLPIQKQLELAKILDCDDSVLNLLMSNIRKDLNSEDLKSELRFNSVDIDAIRKHSDVHRKSAILILLDEWSTMGKRENRPKMKHLFSLLIKCQLFQAADFVAELIGEEYPDRPLNGPGAKVNISLDNEQIEELVNDLNYPYSSVDIKINQNNFVKPSINTPDIRFNSESGNNHHNYNDHNINNDLQRTSSTAAARDRSQQLDRENAADMSDLIKFSTSNVPNLSHNVIDNNIAVSNVEIPMTVNSNYQNHSVFIPALTGLISNASSNNNSSSSQNESAYLPECLQSLEIKSDLPDFSGLIQNSTKSDVNQSSSFITQSSVDETTSM
jgi:hypothetical protein